MSHHSFNLFLLCGFFFWTIHGYSGREQWLLRRHITCVWMVGLFFCFCFFHTMVCHLNIVFLIHGSNQFENKFLMHGSDHINCSLQKCCPSLFKTHAHMPIGICVCSLCQKALCIQYFFFLLGDMHHELSVYCLAKHSTSCHVICFSGNRRRSHKKQRLLQ